MLQNRHNNSILLVAREQSTQDSMELTDNRKRWATAGSSHYMTTLITILVLLPMTLILEKRGHALLHGSGSDRIGNIHFG